VNFFSNRAFAAFTVALAASMWALFTDVGRPYLPSVPILVYTLYLYANRSSVGQLGGDALKDSPYFLGFLLTMFALFKIFNDVASSSSLFGQNPALMTQEVGGAVLTTIVGLFCRQALLALVQDEAPEEDDRLAALANAVTSHAVAFEVARQQFFREMAEERERQTASWNDSQERMLVRLESAGSWRDAAAGVPVLTSAPTPTAPTPTAPTPTAPTPTAPTPTAPTPTAPTSTGAVRSAADAPAAARPPATPPAVAAVAAVAAPVAPLAPVASTPSQPSSVAPSRDPSVAARTDAALDAIVDSVRTPASFDAPRTAPYAGPPAGRSTPPSSARMSPVGSVPAVSSPGSMPGSSGATPPYPPYLGQGRVSDVPRDEG